MEDNTIIFHIDVNSAFLSWEAAFRMQEGDSLDLRTIPSAVGGDISKRRGIILAKSIPAKKFGISTGEPVVTALRKCPTLTLVPANYSLYEKCSDAMVDVLRRYSPNIQRYSVDECFLDYTNMSEHFGSPMLAANHIKNTIKKELGFTVNIGVSSNKLLAKMASDFQKPDLVHSLFPEEIPKKMWPLPVGELFMVGRATASKLKKLGIYTIGELANTDPELLQYHLKSHGLLVWNYAHGRDYSIVTSESSEVKGIGNSTTIPFDVEDPNTAKLVLLSLAESVAMRLRESDFLAGMVSVEIKNNSFESCSHQQQLLTPTNTTNAIHNSACKLFDELWDGSPIRHLGIRTSKLSNNHMVQLNFFDFTNQEKQSKVDKAVDTIRNKYGDNSIIRASFLNSSIKPLNGGKPIVDIKD